MYICVCMYLCIYICICVTPPGHTNNDTDLKFGTHTPIDLISECEFFIFSIKSSWLPLFSKSCCVTWIFRISPRLPYLAFNQLRLKCLNYGAPRIFLGQKLNIPLQTFCRQIRHTYNAANSIPILLKLRDQSYFFLNEKLQ